MPDSWQRSRGQSYQDKVFNFTTTVPYFQLNLYLPSKNFTAVLTYLDVPNFSILCALIPVSDPFYLISSRHLRRLFEERSSTVHRLDKDRASFSSVLTLTSFHVLRAV